MICPECGSTNCFGELDDGACLDCDWFSQPNIESSEEAETNAETAAKHSASDENNSFDNYLAALIKYEEELKADIAAAANGEQDDEPEYEPEVEIEEEPKRKPKYESLPVRYPGEFVEQLREFCKENDLVMRQFVKTAIQSSMAMYDTTEEVESETSSTTVLADQGPPQERKGFLRRILSK